MSHGLYIHFLIADCVCHEAVLEESIFARVWYENTLRDSPY
jgi:hypothetical protein